MDDTTQEKLINIVGQENFTDQFIDRVSYSYDASDHHCRPEAAVWPTSTEQVSRILTGISAVVRKYQLPFVIFGHAGDGNLHPKIMYDAADPDQVQCAGAAVDEIFRLTCRLGGTLTGEHGIGLSKAPFMTLEHDPVEMDIMARIKRLFDPNNILNPGKMGLTICYEKDIAGR